MLEDLGLEKILLIVLVIVVLFGAKKIPELARNLGKGINEFKKGMRDIQDNVDINKDESKEENKKLEAK